MPSAKVADKNNAEKGSLNSYFQAVTTNRERGLVPSSSSATLDDLFSTAGDSEMIDGRSSPLPPSTNPASEDDPLPPPEIDTDTEEGTFQFFN